MPELQPSFLGKGWSFPPSFSANGMGLAMVEDNQDIQQSIQIILSTSTGERDMLANFGCNLNQFLYEEMDQSLANNLSDAVKTALLYSERRIDVINVAVDESQEVAGLLLITITYQVRATNSRYNMVYPYYINEGSPN